MGLISISELTDLLKRYCAEETAELNYSSRTPLWRGVYGPYLVVSGTFKRGGDFEFAIRVPEESITLSAFPARDLFMVD